MIGFCPLASGSKGNSIFLGTKDSRILIDAGTSARQIEKRLLEINVDLATIDAIFITHEHMDHIQALKVLFQKNIPVICNSDTAKGIYNNLNVLPHFKIFTTGESFEFKDLKIFPFNIPHDTLDPVGFTIEAMGLKIGICTDLGFVPSSIVKHLGNLDLLYLESNHQVSMVHASNRPSMYKQRVLGRQGHLSNEECAKLASSIAHKDLRHIFLAHLSSECNNPELAIKTVKEMLEKSLCQVPISIAYQEKISEKILF